MVKLKWKFLQPGFEGSNLTSGFFKQELRLVEEILHHLGCIKPCK